jgi:hypothetical protein
MDRYILIHHEEETWYDGYPDKLESVEYLGTVDDWLDAVKLAFKSNTIIIDLEYEEAHCHESPEVKETYKKFEWYMIDTPNWSRGLKWMEGHPKILSFLYEHHPNLLTKSSRDFFDVYGTNKTRRNN